MSHEQLVRSVAGCLSLHAPQAESLERLHKALEFVLVLRDSKARSPEELAAMTEALAAQFPTLSDFEREFPSLCFALATGVGKTRLMGGFYQSFTSGARLQALFCIGAQSHHL